MNPPPTSSATTPPLRICRSRNLHVYGGQDHIAIQEDPETGSGRIVADIETTPEAEAYASLLAAAPDLRKASQKLYDALQAYLMDIPDRELPDDLVEAMNALEAAWHRADGARHENNKTAACDPVALAEDAIEAFGQFLAERFPQATTGDLSPERIMRLTFTLEAAIEEWIRNNVPSPQSDENAA